MIILGAATDRVGSLDFVIWVKAAEHKDNLYAYVTY